MITENKKKHFFEKYNGMTQKRWTEIQVLTNKFTKRVFEKTRVMKII